MQITEVTDFGLRSAVLTLARSGSPLRFVLYPMVHVGQADFYRQVARRLRQCDLIVAEGYDGPSSTGLAYAIAIRLTRQRSGSRIIHQDINYQELGIPVIWPERLFRNTARRNRMPWWGWLEVALLTPILTVMMAVGVRKWVLRRGYEVSDDSDVRIFLRFLQKPLVNDVDRDLLAALCEIHEARHTEPIQVAVVYGAGHVPAVIQGLYERYRYRARSGEWLDIIDF
ncbi:MAG TPA: hypothetical protein VFX60_14710 [Micromonospora sp.]|nr:hypothetical protein [Micromonospora sp.]